MDHIDITISTIQKNVLKCEKLRIMREMEAKTEKMVLNAMKSGIIPSFIHNNTTNYNHHHNNIDIDKTPNIQTILPFDTDDLEEKVGRNTTYSEIRATYG